MKEQIKQIIDSYGMFHNPKKLEECAEEVAALETQALKEQMERVIGVIDKSYLYLKSVCLAAEDNGELARGYDIAMNEALSQLATLKAELEGENG